MEFTTYPTIGPSKGLAILANALLYLELQRQLYHIDISDAAIDIVHALYLDARN
jgi:hypothetical protein